jgi:hypothetical protein
MKDRQELVSWFNAVEERELPYDIRLEGVPLWPLIRVVCGYRYLLPEMEPKRVLPRVGRAVRLAMIAKGMVQWAALSRRPIHPSLLFSSKQTYRLNTDHGTLDKFAHPLMEAASDIGHHSVLIALDPSVNGPLVIPSRAQVEHVDALLQLLDLWHWQKPMIPLRSIPLMGRLPDVLTEAFGEQVVRYLDKAIHNFRLHLSFARSTLSRIRPSHVFVTCWYSVENMAMAQACHEARTPCIDLQHGVQGPAHLAYGTWKALPVEG